ncbi:MAG: hypothetical protein V4524_00850 [Patescibacteria group bacterium]
MIESEKNFIAKPEKPPVLFHASRSPDIKVFEPRAEKVRNSNEGPKVFATPSRAMASIFLVENDDSWTQSGTIEDVPYIVISDKERFLNLDKGGLVYSLPSDTFENNPEEGLGDLEWTSDKKVVPIGQEFVPSALIDMIKNGVKVYFVNESQFHEIQNASDQGRSIIDSLTPEQFAS